MMKLIGLDAKRTSLEEDLVTFIDAEKYLEEFPHARGRRELKTDASVPNYAPNFVHTSGPSYPTHPMPSPSNHHGNHSQKFIENNGDDDGEHHHNVCADPENEVYQKCGGKCVMGCRYATTSPGSISISKHDCDKNDCVEGCFCKTGLVRHQTRCIQPTECPIRKCHRDEVYVSINCLFIEFKKKEFKLI